MTPLICVRLSVPGFHYWGNAPLEVAFLRSRHRHLFTIEATLAPRHDDRDMEFFLVRRQLAEAVDRMFLSRGSMGYEFGERSCESIARELVEALPAWPWVRCVVWEDMENGGGVGQS